MRVSVWVVYTVADAQRAAHTCRNSEIPRNPYLICPPNGTGAFRQGGASPYRFVTNHSMYAIVGLDSFASAIGYMHRRVSEVLTSWRSFS